MKKIVKYMKPDTILSNNHNIETVYFADKKSQTN